MKKAVYTTPHMQVLTLEASRMICTSNIDVNSINTDIELIYEGGSDGDVIIR